MKIRVRVGVNEVEIEAPISNLEKAITLIPSMVQQLPVTVPEPAGRKVPGAAQQQQTQHIERPEVPPIERMTKPEFPEIRVERDDSLTDVIAKIFKEPWGRRPRKLIGVREALESYGLIYPKQSVAVALLRLAQSGRLRRFKGEFGEFVYTASTSLAGEGGGIPAPPPQDNVNLGAEKEEEPLAVEQNR